MKGDRSFYTNALKSLVDTMNGAAETPFSNYAKVVCLTVMNMRYEKISFESNLNQHPFMLTKQIINDTINHFIHFMDISFIENSNALSVKKGKSNSLEEKHQELWQEIWTRHDNKEFDEFIELKAMRLRVNDLVQYVEGKDCIDFGCGNSSFAFALLQCGANHVTGIDFGHRSVKFGKHIAKLRNLEDKTEFIIDNVTSSKLPSNHYGFAVSNGVFHHLAEEEVILALKEVARVLKPGGWFWYYVDGKDAISMHLWEATVDVLKDVDILFIENILKTMNVSRNKTVHVMDSSSATYLHSTWEEVKTQLTKCGFGNFKRLTGATSTDFDAEVIEKDPYGVEKVGAGDLRIACQLIEN